MSKLSPTILLERGNLGSVSRGSSPPPRDPGEDGHLAVSFLISPPPSSLPILQRLAADSRETLQVERFDQSHIMPIKYEKS